MTRVFKIIGWVALAGLASLVALGSLRYFVVSPEKAIEGPLAQRFAEYLTPLLFHAGGGAVALVVGAWGFWGKLRDRYLVLHRWLGRVYLLAVLVGGTAGLYLSLTAYGGLPTRVGFGTLGVLWLSTGAMAYLRIRRGETRLHREWMIRNYALAFSAVTLRLWMPLLVVLAGYEFTEAYRTLAWLCWVPNLLLAEMIIGFGRAGAEGRRLRPAS